MGVGVGAWGCLLVPEEFLHLGDGDVAVFPMLRVAPVDPQTAQQEQSGANSDHNACHHQAALLHMKQQGFSYLCAQEIYNLKQITSYLCGEFMRKLDNYHVSYTRLQLALQ